jgi:hypothetical protein
MFVVLVGSIMIGAMAFGDGPSFPYQAFALRDGVEIRSGPGLAHYATEELRQGDIVEVWRHDPDGWCAIRPVDESFSLIPQSAVKPINDETCEVIVEGAQAWVGTRLGPVERPMWQVKLKVGEHLEILGEANWPDPDGHSTSWYQIAPPSGEFRWVHRDDLQLPDPKTQLPEATGVPNQERKRQHSLSDIVENADKLHIENPSSTWPDRQAVQLSGGSDFETDKPAPQSNGVIVDPFGDDEVPENPSDVPANSQGWRRASQPIRLAQLQRDSDSSTNDRIAAMELPDPPRQVSNTALNNNDSNSFGAIERQVVPTIGNEFLTDGLRQVDMELSLEIIKPAYEWQLSRFTQSLISAQSTAQSNQERDQAQKLLAKVERLRTLQTNLVGTTPAKASNGPGNANVPRPVGSGVDPSVQYGTTYDAYGWLNELVQKSGTAQSKYVLQDDNGKILCQIDPSPGLNLHRYMKSKIGVLGQRGFNQSMNLNHVTADRVVVLEKRDTTIR